jgi:hypothetical protein
VKILVYGNRKSPNVYYLIDTPERELKAYLTFFKELDEYWRCYDEANKVHTALVEKARSGDGESAKKLLKSRSSYEYEYVHEEEVKIP